MIVKIQGRVRDYDWGRSDKNCLVYEFSSTEFKNQKYAELWMGSHPSAPSLYNGQPLSLYLQQHKLPQLNYLFKILSIEKCLSIQTHPTKSQAEHLHLSSPALYPDPNDKPQMFLTLTTFKAFMGFISDEDLKGLLGQEPFTDFKAKDVKGLLEEILKLTKEDVEKKVQYLVENRGKFKGREELLRSLQEQFPKDVGILVSMILQYEELKPGIAYYIKPGQPHAYVQGECLELMKNSDNVVRLGLTPKQKDTETLMKILDYENREIEKLVKKDSTYVAGELILHEVLHDDKVKVHVPSVGIVLQGEFIANGIELKHKDILLFHPGEYSIQGKGRLYLAQSKS